MGGRSTPTRTRPKSVDPSPCGSTSGRCGRPARRPAGPGCPRTGGRSRRGARARDRAATLSAPRAGPTDWPASFMNVCGISTATHGGDPGADPPFGEQTPVTALRLGQLPPHDQQLGDLKPDVVTAALVFRAGVAQPDDQPVGGGAAAPREWHADLLGVGAGLVRAGVVAGALFALADDLGLLLDLVFVLTCSRGGVRVATTDSGSSSSSGPRARSAPRGQRVADLHLGDVVRERVGNVVGQRLDVSSRNCCSSTPPSLTPGASSTPVSSRNTVAWILTSRRTRSRSICTVTLVTGWRTSSLTTTGLTAAFDRQVHHGAGVRQRKTQRPPEPRSHRILAAAVDDAEDLAGAAQAPRLTRPGGSRGRRAGR